MNINTSLTNKLSIVIPVFHNELNLPLLYEKIYESILNTNLCETELIFVDDGSEDNSYNELIKLHNKNNKIKIIKLSRNFGSHIAIQAGLNYVTGDCATVISADLQDPPEIILKMYEKWKAGNKVVLAIRQDREEPFLQKTISNLYYKLMKKYALKNMPNGGFDCFLIDRAVIEIIKNMREKNSTLMGQILWCGFKTDSIHYIRKKRELGESMWTLSKKIKFFIDSFMAFSYFPIRFISTFGFTVAFLGFLLALFEILFKFIYHNPIQGWTSMVVIILILAGVQLITLGIIGEYLWRNFDETKKRPLFIIEDEIGLDK